MSRYSNDHPPEPTTFTPFGKGARRRVRDLKRLEAELRNGATPAPLRRAARRAADRAARAVGGSLGGTQ